MHIPLLVFLKSLLKLLQVRTCNNYGLFGQFPTRENGFWLEPYDTKHLIFWPGGFSGFQRK